MCRCTLFHVNSPSVCRERGNCDRSGREKLVACPEEGHVRPARRILEVDKTGDSGSTTPRGRGAVGDPQQRLTASRPDDRMLEAVRRREPEALGEFFELYFDRLYNVAYRLTGGRDGGYRGYTFKKNVQSGDWRINIKTEDGLLLGRVDFTIFAITDIDRKWRISQKY